MAQFLTPSQIFEQYKSILKSIKPSLNVNDQNSDFIIRGKAFCGLISGLYGDQAKTNNDTYTSSARPTSLALEGADLAIVQQPATPAKSTQIRITGTNGTVINPGDLTFLYNSTGVFYTNTTGGTVALGVLDVQILAQISGQIGNVKAPDSLTVVAPPTGVGAFASVILDIADGADIETTDSYRLRILNHKQQPPAGGNQYDYPNFAFAADPSVRTAFIFRFGRGLGTVDVYITTGTSDIDTAVTQGYSIVRIPSGGTIAAVQAYYDANAPLTDCANVYAPSELAVPATVNVVLASGITLSTVPADGTNNPLNLNVQQLIQREVGRAMYKLAVGGRKVPGSANGFVTAADIEENLDVWLSAVKDPQSGIVIGKIPVLANRQVQKLDPPNYDKQLLANQLATPGTITVVLGV